MILDTSYLLALGEGDPAAFDRGVELAESGDVQWLPVPVVQELAYGLAYTGSEEERRRARNVCRLYPTVDVTEATARRAGALLARADLDHGGEVGAAGVDSIDPQVAAVADLLDDAVLTGNVRDFERLGVPVEPF